MCGLTIPVLLLWVSTFFPSTLADCPPWRKEDEDRICTLAESNSTFCSTTGAADSGCQTVATAVNGSDPKCADVQVCAFTLNGSTAYVSCNAVKAGYDILRNCVNNIGIACPNSSANLSDTTTLINITGKEGCGSHDSTSLANHEICSASDDSLTYCESQILRDDIIKNFHPERRLGNLCGGVCMNIRNSTDEKNYVEVIRCVLAGSYYNESGQRDLCRFHFYNQGEKISAVAYWGSQNLLRLEDVV